MDVYIELQPIGKTTSDADFSELCSAIDKEDTNKVRELLPKATNLTLEQCSKIINKASWNIFFYFPSPVTVLVEWCWWAPINLSAKSIFELCLRKVVYLSTTEKGLKLDAQAIDCCLQILNSYGFELKKWYTAEHTDDRMENAVGISLRDLLRKIPNMSEYPSLMKYLYTKEERQAQASMATVIAHTLLPPPAVKSTIAASEVLPQKGPK